MTQYSTGREIALKGKCALMEQKKNHLKAEMDRTGWQERCYDQYAPVARQVINRILYPAGSREDVEELVQDVMWELLEHPEKYQEERGSLTVYVAVLSRSRALNARKKLGCLRTVPMEGMMELGYEDSRLVKELELKELVGRILASLKPREQRLFTMRFLYHMTIEEIAVHLKCSRGAVDVRISRLRRKLETLFAAQGITIRTDGRKGGA